MEKNLTLAIDRYVDEHRDQIIADLDRLVRIPSVSKPGSPEPEPFGPDCARVLDEAIALAQENGMSAKNYDNWYGLAVRGEGPHTVGIFSHLDVVEVGDDWTFPPFQVTEKDGWLFGRGVADDKIAAILGIYTAKALDELDLAHGLKLVLYLGVSEEKGMTDLDRYLREHEQPEFNLVPDYKFPGSIGETGVLKFKLKTSRHFTHLSALRGGEPGKRLPLEASVIYSGLEGGRLLTLAENRENITAVQEDKAVRLIAKGRPETSWNTRDSINALEVLTAFLRDSGVLSGEDRALMDILADMVGSAQGECFGIDRESALFGNTKCTCQIAEETEEGLLLSFDVRYPFEITGEEIQSGVAAYGAKNGFSLTDVNDTSPWLLDEADPRLDILCRCWNEVSGREDKLGVGGGTYARKLKNAVSYGPKDLMKCPFLPAGHGEIHSPDETRSVDSILNAVKVYIRAFVELDAYYQSK